MLLPFVINWLDGIVLNIQGSLAIICCVSAATCLNLFSLALPQLQQLEFFSVSLKNGKGSETLGALGTHGQYSTLGT